MAHMKIPPEFRMFAAFLKPVAWMLKRVTKRPELMRTFEASAEKKLLIASSSLTSKRKGVIGSWVLKMLMQKGLSKRLVAFLRAGSVEFKRKHLRSENSKVFYQFMSKVRERNRPFAGIQVDPKLLPNPALIGVAERVMCNVPFIAMFLSRFFLSDEYCYAVADFLGEYRQYESKKHFEEKALALMKSYELLAEGTYSPALDFMYICQKHGIEAYDPHATLGVKMVKLRGVLGRSLRYYGRFIDGEFLILRNAVTHSSNRRIDVKRRRIIILNKGRLYGQYSLRQFDRELGRLANIVGAMIMATQYYLINWEGNSPEIIELLEYVERELAGNPTFQKKVRSGP